MLRRLQSNPIVEQYRRAGSSPPRYLQSLLALLALAFVCAALILPVASLLLVLMPVICPLIIAARSAAFISRETHREEYDLIRISGLSHDEIAHAYLYTAYLRSRLWVWLPLLSPLFAALRLFPFSEPPTDSQTWLLVALIAALFVSVWLQNAVALMVGFAFGRRVDDAMLARLYAALIVLVSVVGAAAVFVYSFILPATALPVILVILVVIFPAALAYTLFRRSPRWV